MPHFNIAIHGRLSRMRGNRVASGTGADVHLSSSLGVGSPTHRKILSNYIVKRGSEYLQGRTILELGSGTGMVGLVAGKLGAKVWITDQA